MVRKKAMSRRTFLKGAGGVVIALPFLDAMIPTFAQAQSAPVRRFIPIYYGSVNGGRINPSSTGPLTAQLGDSIKVLEAVKSHISIVSGLTVPQVGSSQVPGPGEATQKQHGKVESPILSGMRSLPNGTSGFENIYSLIRGTTSDQIAADFLGAGSLMKSLQVRTQASVYNNTGRAVNHMSVRKSGSVLEEMRGIVSPQELFDKLFSVPLPSGGGTSSTASSLPAKGKSVLDLVLDDANRLSAQVSGQDKERLDVHFDKIREIEKSIANTQSGGGTGSSAGTCTVPVRPGADPSISTQDFGGWANETLRGQIQADLIAHALQCDLVRAVSWMLTQHQVWINSNKTSGSTVVPNGGGLPEIHSDSHSAPRDINCANFNWAAQFFGRLVTNLKTMNDAHGTILDNTFVVMTTAEAATAHSRTNLTYLVSGCPDKIKNGHHVAAGGVHPARLLVSGLQAIGMNTNKLGEVSGRIDGLHV